MLVFQKLKYIHFGFLRFLKHKLEFLLFFKYMLATLLHVPSFGKYLIIDIQFALLTKFVGGCGI
jgi:hypothetical protein